MVGEAGASSLATLPATPELMAYYQQRCDEFTRLEEDYLSRIQALEASVEERHKARWQFLRAESEVEDLQQALSDTKLALLDEKERVVQLSAENDTLKLQEIQDRQRIQQLLSLTEANTEEVTLFKEKLPAHLVRTAGDCNKENGFGFHAGSSGSAGLVARRDRTCAFCRTMRSAGVSKCRAYSQTVS